MPSEQETLAQEIRRNNPKMTENVRIDGIHYLCVLPINADGRTIYYRYKVQNDKHLGVLGWWCLPRLYILDDDHTVRAVNNYWIDNNLYDLQIGVSVGGVSVWGKPKIGNLIFQAFKQLVNSSDYSASFLRTIKNLNGEYHAKRAQQFYKKYLVEGYKLAASNTKTSLKYVKGRATALAGMGEVQRLIIILMGVVFCIVLSVGGCYLYSLEWPDYVINIYNYSGFAMSIFGMSRGIVAHTRADCLTTYEVIGAANLPLSIIAGYTELKMRLETAGTPAILVPGVPLVTLALELPNFVEIIRRIKWTRRNAPINQEVHGCGSDDASARILPASSPRDSYDTLSFEDCCSYNTMEVGFLMNMQSDPSDPDTLVSLNEGIKIRNS